MEKMNDYTEIVLKFSDEELIKGLKQEADRVVTIDSSGDSWIIKLRRFNE